MANFDLLVPQFTINAIRSVATDTLVTSTALVVNNEYGALHDDWGMQTLSLGDHVPGQTVTVNMGFRNVDVPDVRDGFPDGGSIYWTFLLLNAGNGSQRAFLDAFNSTSGDFAGAFAGVFGSEVAGRIAGQASAVEAGAVTAGWVGALIAVGIVAAQQVVDLLTANCDGQVAAGVFHLTAAQLGARPSSWTIVENNPGLPSSGGCGGNSNYDVAYDVVRYTGPAVDAPPLRGLDPQAAEQRLKALGLSYAVGGVWTSPNIDSPVVTAQTPPAGTPCPPGAVVTVTVEAPGRRGGGGGGKGGGVNP